MGVKMADHMNPREWVLLEGAEGRKKKVKGVALNHFVNQIEFEG